MRADVDNERMMAKYGLPAGDFIWSSIPKTEQVARTITILFYLVRKLAPCIVYISSLHELRVDQTYMQLDTTFLVSTLLKNMSREVYTHFKAKVMFIGSTIHTKHLDPLFLSRNRFQRLIRFRTFTKTQREQMIVSFLRTKGFNVKNQIHSAQISEQIMGYVLRDIAGLINEVFLINTSRSYSINADVINVALYRQKSAIKNIGIRTKQLQAISISDLTAYKVGKSLIKKIIQPLFKQTLFWKTRFLYFSTFCFETHAFQSSIKECLVLPYIYSCLAGSAARDVWTILNQTIQERNTYIV